MKSFITNIKKHYKITLVCLAVLIAAIIIAVLLMRSDSGSDKKEPSNASGQESVLTSEYFTDSDYPFTVTKKDDTLTIVFYSRITNDQEWYVQADHDGIVSVTQKDKDSTEMLTVVLEALKAGYTTVSFKQTGEVEGLSFDLVDVEADIVVYSDGDEKLSIRLADIRQNTSSTGALDTESPYLLRDNRVYFLKGGDGWTLKAANDKANSDRFIIMPGTDEKGYDYIQAEMYLSGYGSASEDGSSSSGGSSSGSEGSGSSETEVSDESGYNELILKNEKLGVEKKIRCVLNSEREWILVDAEKTE